MFKKLKDKLAEEVKSSPQRIQQFAQAAQAAVTSASSSISDITNNDLFSIGDNDSQQNRANKGAVTLNNPQNTFQNISLMQPIHNNETMDSSHELIESQRQRRLSNSSFASDISFRLPSYESPSMYHLQSDMEISASEAEERGFSSGTVNLDRVTKEQLYAAYRRTQERYTKYRNQYADLARHYKLLEKENAKARSVLVETQDKALRRISELREQCALEQSAKAHLEKALRVEIDEKNTNIDVLHTKIKLLQCDRDLHKEGNHEHVDKVNNEIENHTQLIDFSSNGDKKSASDELITSEISTLNNKIEKMEQLLNKYKESLKTVKEKNAQMTTELQLLSNELENKKKENEQLSTISIQLNESKQKIQELTDINEQLQNKINSFKFNENKEKTTLEIDLQKAQEEITELRSKIDVFIKREEEYAISLAENKLTIHKELESKEAEIKSLKGDLSASKKEIESLNIVLSDYKNNISLLEEERSKHKNDVNELNLTRAKLTEIESEIKDLHQKNQLLEQSKAKADEEFKYLELQLKQEMAEKLAMIDRNTYLENRNKQLTEEVNKKNFQISNIENELQMLKNEKETINSSESDSLEKDKLLEELNIWKSKYTNLESEIQDEREELVKLQSEIETLLTNHELIQTQNSELHATIATLNKENTKLQQQILENVKMKNTYNKLSTNVKELKQHLSQTCKKTKTLTEINQEFLNTLKEKINELISQSLSQVTEVDVIKTKFDVLKKDYLGSQNELKIYKEQNLGILQELQSLQEENNKLKSKINENSDILLNDLNTLKREKEDLLAKIKKINNKCQHIEKSVKQIDNQHLIDVDKIKLLESDKKDLLNTIEQTEHSNKVLSKELNDLKNHHSAIINENQEMNNKIKDIEEKLSYIDKLQDKNNVLNQDNVALQTEIGKIKKIYQEIEKEKQDLCSIIEKLETKEHKDNIDTQTDDLNFVSSHEWELVSKENDLLKIKCEQIKQEKEAIYEKLMAMEHKRSESNAEAANGEHIKLSSKLLEQESDLNDGSNNKKLKDEHELLKEENRRFKSDIEGLQTYLTKISKENGILNDKLRDLIASSENSPEKNELLPYESNEFKNEIQSARDKIDDLLRENTLLIEENLELKDQLNSHNYENNPPADSENIQEYLNLKEKCDKLLEAKIKLERRLMDLEATNKSVSVNMQQLQDNNEKLRLNNEKLERRLDEALVSLRHLHSLEENTELEYLRNILYEYLTGPGTHSFTLAKVLSAVVKFDNTQTQLILQKERERQGLLRQLGLI